MVEVVLGLEKILCHCSIVVVPFSLAFIKERSRREPLEVVLYDFEAPLLPMIFWNVDEVEGVNVHAVFAVDAGIICIEKEERGVGLVCLEYFAEWVNVHVLKVNLGVVVDSPIHAIVVSIPVDYEPPVQDHSSHGARD